MLRAALFDLDDTLFSSTRLTRKARWEACEAMLHAGLPAHSVKEAYLRLQDIVHRTGSNDARHFNRLCESYGLKSPEIIVAGRIAYHNAKFALLYPFPKTEESLLALSKAGLKLGIVTNGLVEKQWEKILRLKLRHFFDTVVISGSARPKDKRPLLRRALRELHVPAREAAYVGDKLKTDIAAANSLGMVSVRFIPPGDAQKPGKGEKPAHTIRSLAELASLLPTRTRER